MVIENSEGWEPNMKAIYRLLLCVLCNDGGSGNGGGSTHKFWISCFERKRKKNLLAGFDDVMGHQVQICNFLFLLTNQRVRFPNSGFFFSYILCDHLFISIFGARRFQDGGIEDVCSRPFTLGLFLNLPADYVLEDA